MSQSPSTTVQPDAEQRRSIEGRSMHFDELSANGFLSCFQVYPNTTAKLPP